MKFTAQLQHIDFDLKSYLRVFDQAMEEMTKEAARSWLRTVLDIIPTWSGASRATFEALAKDIGTNVSYGPIVAKKNRVGLGRNAGKGGINVNGTKYSFYYETDLRYLEYNEFNTATPGPPPQPFGQLRNPTPYHFLEAGKNDFESFKQNVKLPDPSLFISGSPI